MLRSLEFKQDALDVQAQIKALCDKGEDVPAELVAEYNDCKAQMQTALADEAKRKHVNSIKEDKKMDKKLFNSAFKNLLKGKTQDFMDAVGDHGNLESVDARGGYLVPSELLDLDEYGGLVAVPARVIPVWSSKGNIPSVDLSQAKSGAFLASFDEISAMDEVNPIFANIPYVCTEKGAVVPVSMRLLNDSASDVVGVIGQVFGQAVIAQRNADILSAVAGITNLTNYYAGNNKTFADKEAIQKIREAILKLSGVNRINAKVVVCDTTFAKLAQIEDGHGHPYLCQDVTKPSIYRLEGCEVVSINDCFMTASNTLTEVAYVGNFDRVAVIERQGLEISTDASNMFNKDAIAVKGKVANVVKVLEGGAFAKVNTGAAPQG